MARQRITKQQAEREFRAEVLPSIQRQHEQDGRIDRPARAQAWNDYVDMLERDGRISMVQAANWTPPPIVG